MTKLQLTLTNQEAFAISSEASRLGYAITRYVKFVIAKITENFMKTSGGAVINEQTEKDAADTLRVLRRGELRKITSGREL